MSAFPLVANLQSAFPLVRREPQGRLYILRIQQEVARHYNIPLLEMKSARSSIVLARPRQVAMWLARRLTRQSTPEIGRRFGGRDHTTVLHAVKKIDALRALDDDIRDETDVLRATLKAAA